MQAFEECLRKIGSNGGVNITRDDVTIALSRINAQLTLDDIRAFFNVVSGGQPREDHLSSGEDSQV